jgi:peptidoglycan/LPS O-acetylase OafA/YrhL
MSDMGAVVDRVRRRALGLAVLAIAAAFVVGWRSGLSLTIAAAVVIFSFLALEKLIERLVPQQTKPSSRSLWSLLLVTVASLALMGVVLWQWKGFDPVAGAVGLSVVVLAVVPEVWERK